jgi:Tol biopolymer transport system component
MAYLQPEAWSPDAKHILAQFTRKDGANQIGWVSVADGSVQVLKTMDWRYPLEVSLSPDGRFLAYDLASQQDSSQRDIFLLAADGSQELPLVQHPANDLLLGWSPNGQYILFASDRTGTMDMWLLPVDEATPTGSLQLLKRGVGRVRPMGFTQSGAFYYAVPTGMNDVYTASVDLAAGMVLTGPSRVTESSVGSNTLPAWSPEGRYLAYVSQPPDEHFSIGFDSQITIREVETGSERQFRPQLTHIGDLRWAPDGQHLLLVGYDKNRVYSRSLYRMHIESGEITPILRSQYESSVYEIIPGPEGNGILYHQDDLAAGACRFLTLDMESGEEKELLRVVRPSFAGVLALSPDGRYLAFTRLEPQARTLEVMPAQGGQAAELLRLEDKSEYITGVAWTPDGRYILFARSKLGSGAALWRIPAAGGEPEKLGLTQEGLLQHLRVHPQGKQIAFMAAMPYKPEVWVLENFLPKPEAEAARLEDE